MTADKYWGTPVKRYKDHWEVFIRKVFIQKDQPLRVGVNEKLLLAAQDNDLHVRVEDKGIEFEATPQDFLNSKEIHYEPSRIYPLMFFRVFLLPIPSDAKRNFEVTPLPDLNDEDNKNREEHYRFHQR